MKYIFLLLAIIPFSSLFPENFIKIIEITGRVDVKEPGQVWNKAYSGRIIPQGTVVATGFRSEAKLNLADSSTIYIKQLSRLSLNRLSIKNKKADTKLNLKLGRIKAEVKTSRGLKHNFTLRTPVSTAAVKGTVFEASATGKLIVETGKIKHSNKIEQSAFIRGGASSYVRRNGYTLPESELDSFNEEFNVEPSTLPPEAVIYHEIIPKDPSTTGSIIVDWGKPSLP